MCSSLHDEQHKTTGMCLVVGERRHQHLRLGTFCAHINLRNVSVLFEFISFFLSSLHSESMKACTGLEERCSVPLSGCVGSGSGLFSTLRP